MNTYQNKGSVTFVQDTTSPLLVLSLRIYFTMNHKHSVSSQDHNEFAPSRSCPAVSTTNRPSIIIRRCPASPRQYKSRRVLFALTIKYLLAILKSRREDVLLQNTKIVVATCTRLSRLRDPTYTPLENVIESSLRHLVGNLYWEMAQQRARRQYSLRCASTTALQSTVEIQARHNGAPM
jgi:hypothetical protein